ncbi:PP2C family protein-serine/threonine phosphatase [Ferrimonas senticii]|uniref:PP2C family protein-serine/threonine phosphatase n=1 Tax=Ferrimonas senticii TaxID=394566 RepID=UPI00041E457A|nr:SpoIIE family protein phosphatase [Ferrimonas senticii]
MKVLLIEDARDVRQVLKASLSRYGYQVFDAEHGAAGLQLLQQHPDIQLVVSDVLMPVMDGHELCRVLKQKDFGRFVYLILLSSRDQEQEIIEGLELGADDFLAKQSPLAELNARMGVGRRIIELHNELNRQNEKLNLAYDQIKKDLMVAAEMHSNLLPTQKSFPGSRFAWLCNCCAFMGGDMFDYQRIDEHVVAFYLLDVSGHGIPSALLSFTLKYALSPSHKGASLLKRYTDNPPNYEILQPVEVVAKLNERFMAPGSSSQYFTMIYGLLDSRSGRVTVCQAGHPGLLHQQHHGDTIERSCNGFPVGMLPDVEYEQFEFQMTPGDRLFLFSDGVTECFNPAKEEYGTERLIKVLQQHKAMSIDQQVTEVERQLVSWNQSNQFDDDVSLLAIEWHGQ